MRESERLRGTKRGGDLVVLGNRTKVAGVEIIQLSNEEVNVVWRDRVVLLKVIESNEGRALGRSHQKT